MIRRKSYARAGLVGNPSDGYFGKTISFIVKNFEAEVILYESPELEILPAARDHSVFPGGIGELAQDVGFFWLLRWNPPAEGNGEEVSRLLCRSGP